jgi:CheY-like chemotaxis protein
MNLSNVASGDHVVIVEDNDDDYESLARAAVAAGFSQPMQWARSAEECLSLLGVRPPGSCLPALIVLDLNLTGMRGRELLRILKSDPVLSVVPVVIFTTSRHPDDIEGCLRDHANAFHVKPMGLERLEEEVKVILEYWLGHTRSSRTSGRPMRA